MNRTPRRLALVATMVIVTHAAVFVWHLLVAANVPPGLPATALTGAAAMHLTLVAGLVMLWHGAYRPAAVLILLPMGAMFAIGVTVHVLSSGPANVFDLPDSPWVVSFRVSAVLLLLLEAAGCWVAARAWRARKPTEPTREPV